MIPLATTLALAIFSLICSAFVILRILIPVLPPHNLGQRLRSLKPERVSSIPTSRSLSPADKSHIWLALCDIIALAIFVWEAVDQALGTPSGYQTASDVGSTVRLWLALTLRQTCFLVISALILLHMRMGRSVRFGVAHSHLWAPVAFLVVSSTIVAGVFARMKLKTFFFGYIGYSCSVVLLNTVMFSCLVGTLVVIKHNLAALDEANNAWPPTASPEKRRGSFATADIEAMREGSSWITSRVSSPRESISAFSFSTAQTRTPPPPHSTPESRRTSKGIFGSNKGTPIRASLRGRAPPVSYRNPVPRRSSTAQRSHSSWLTSSLASRPTVSAWSFPTWRQGTPDTPELEPALASTHDPNTSNSLVAPAMARANEFGGYLHTSDVAQGEKANTSLVAAHSSEIDVSIPRILGWMSGMWVPLVLALPYFVCTSASNPEGNNVASILLVVSVTISSPILSLNLLLRHPIPIPTSLFESPEDPPSFLARSPSPTSSLHSQSNGHKRMPSVTVVDGRQSTDVWLTKSDAVDGKSRLGRALGMLAPAPKLSVLSASGMERPALQLPIQEKDAGVDDAPPSDQTCVSNPRYSSRPSTPFSSADESLALRVHVMTALRQHSAPATSMAFPAISQKYYAGADDRGSEHRSVGTAEGTQFTVSSVPAAHLASHHSCSVASSGAQFSPINPRSANPFLPSPPSVRERRLAHKGKAASVGGAAWRSGPSEMSTLTASPLKPFTNTHEIAASRTRTNTSRAESLYSVDDGMESCHIENVIPSTNSSGERFRMTMQSGSPVFQPTSINAVHGPGEGSRASLRQRQHLRLPSPVLVGDGGLQSLGSWRPEAITVQAASPSQADDCYAFEGSAQVPQTPSASHLPSAPFGWIPSSVNTTSKSFPMFMAALEKQDVLSSLPSANESQVTLFDATGLSGALAESTPPDYRAARNSSSAAAHHHPISPIGRLVNAAAVPGPSSTARNVRPPVLQVPARTKAPARFLPGDSLRGRLGPVPVLKPSQTERTPRQRGKTGKLSTNAEDDENVTSTAPQGNRWKAPKRSRSLLNLLSRWDRAETPGARTFIDVFPPPQQGSNAT